MRLLPGLLAEIAAAAGTEAALKVAAAKGGRLAYFPARPAPGHWLSQTVGHETARIICAAVAPGQGGVELLVPMGPRASEVERWRALRRLDGEGRSGPEIAATLGMHLRSVQYHRARALKRVEAALRQLDFFEAP